MMEIGVARGAYHFARKSLDAVKQAKHFVDTISQMDILPTDILILDAEETGQVASFLWAWFEYVRKVFPQNMLMLYSSKRLLDPIIMTAAEKEYFKKIPIWTAGYPYFPDTFNTIPSGYIPDRTKYGEPYLWQYSEKGIIAGIQGSVDLNYITPEFLSLLGNNAVTGENMAIWKGTAKTVAKVWKDVGLQQVTQIPAGETVSGDGEKIAAGTKYLHVTTPRYFGWTKAEWLNYSYPPVPEPEPEPEPIPTGTVSVTHRIDIYENGKISVDGNAPF